MLVEQHTHFKWAILGVISVLFVILNVSQDVSGAVKHGQTPRHEKLQFIHSDAQNVYRHYCAHCHGAEGNGEGKSYPIEFDPKPRDFTDAGYMATLKDADIKKVIVGGSASVKKSKYCPAWGKTFDGQMIKKLIAYVRSFSGPPAAAAEEPAKGGEGGGAADTPEEIEAEAAAGTSPFITWPILIAITGFLIWRAIAVCEHISFFKGPAE